MNGGVTFGASQSFPQPSAGNNGAFNFQPPSSNSFTFGAPSDAPNPFANLNGTSDAQDISMESPQKKAAFGNTFGSNSFTFGQPAPQPSNPFGSLDGNQTAKTNGSILFGQTTTTSAPSNPFGQSAQSNPFGGFGGSQPPASQAQTSGFGGFGSTTNNSSATTSASFGSFGQNNPITGQSALPAFGTQQGSDTQTQSQPSKFVFGQASSSSQPPSKGLFGSSAPPGQSSGSNLFGPTPSQPSSSGFTFGQSSNQAAPTTNPFANPNASKPDAFNSAPASSDKSASISQPVAEPNPALKSPEKLETSGSDAPAVNPFAGLFGSASSTAQVAPASKPVFSFSTQSQPPAPVAGEGQSKPAFGFGTASNPGAKVTDDASTPMPGNSPFTFASPSRSAAQASDSSEPKTSAPTFKFGSTASPGGSTASGLFGKPAQPEDSEATTDPPTTDEDKGNAKQTTSTPPFSFNRPSQSVSSGGLFSPAKPSIDNGAPSGGLFSKLNSAVETSAKTQPLFGAQAKSATPTFTSASEVGTESSTGAAEALKTAPPTFGGASLQASGQSQPALKPQSTAARSEAASSQVSKSPAAKPSFPAPGPATQAQNTAENTPDSAVTQAPNKRPVYTKGPTRVPGHITAQQFQEYDRDYRLHSLNHGFQQKLASLDPRSHDFDNVIRHYVAARDNIGASLGMYIRNVAGTKRKGDQVDDHEEPGQNKRSREEPAQKPFSFGGTNSSHSTSSATNNAASTPSQGTKLPDDGIPKSTSASTSGLSQSTSGFKPTTANTAGFGPTSSGSTNAFASLNTGSTSTTSAPSTTPVKSPPKKPGFEMPKFGGGSSTNFLAAFGQQAKESSAKFEKDLLEKRKAEEFDSDEDDEEQYRKKVEEDNRAKRAKIDAIAKGGFKPSFGAASTEKAGKPAFGGLGTAASANSFAALTSTPISDGRSAADDDDDNEDGSYVDDKDEDEDEANSSSDDRTDDGEDGEGGDADAEEEQREESLPEDEVVQEGGDEEDDDNDLQAAMDRARKNPNAGKSLFERIEPNPNKEKATPTTNGNKKEPEDASPIMQPTKNSSFPPAVWGSHIGKTTPEQPSFSPLTPTTGASTVKPASTFIFTPAPTTTPTPALGASIFSGGAVRGGPVPGEGLFGSRPSTPSNAEKNGNLAKSVLTSPAGTDNTWKPGNSISFANGDNALSAPTFKFTAASPGEKDKNTSSPFGTLFGTAAPGSSGTVTPNLGFQFGAPTSTPAPGFLGAVSHLASGSAASSAASSRATSPGVSENESVATNETEDTTEDPQTSLMDSRAGEENETTLWEGRSKALMFVNAETAKGTKYTPNDWNSVGIGQVRVLKDKTSNKTRLVFRVEPSANILFNSHLVGSTTYESVPSNKSGAVRGALMYKGNLTRLVFKLKTAEMANELAKVLEENKSV
ncbi:hypothetical protein G647_09056 [Cladophialophora carrionii CBS 160.54]|uniref:RanBD1 domain-containing protein n=1 Tax=Cladophialophora carrionii CBS 160.54 TaxID=1279043 RepID=V9D063_9EURO|nr:uncharacterized protein G647_09056 [Cladophialophora carrionii CBS 160.54]ETI20041.1 hypothetical protein G647_09056 [Cladophialophora carrionii CBS 160.54]